MSTYVLVHGGAHGGWCYRPLAHRLRAAGHDVWTPTLTGLGERSHLRSADVDLEMHIHDVVNVLFYEDLHAVILVGHSYGGVVITGVADRATDRIGHVVHLDALVPANGECAADYTEHVAMIRQGSRVIDGVEVVLDPDAGTDASFGVNDPDIVAWMRPRLTPHPWRCFEQPLVLRNEAAMRALPHTAIVASPSLVEVHPERYESARAADRLWYVETGHDLMLSEPDRVAELLLRLARGGSPPG